MDCQLLNLEECEVSNVKKKMASHFRNLFTADNKITLQRNQSLLERMYVHDPVVHSG